MAHLFQHPIDGSYIFRVHITYDNILSSKEPNLKHRLLSQSTLRLRRLQMEYGIPQQRRRFPFYILLVCFFYGFFYAFCAQEAILPTEPLPAIPSNLWQVFFDNYPYSRLGESIQSWIMTNRDSSYTVISDRGANDFVKKHYSNRPEILSTFLDLKYPIFRADLLRYLLLDAEGGVYSDVDTTAKKPFRDWVPQHLQPHARAIVGIEYDQPDGPLGFGYQERLSFAQWTLASAKGQSYDEKGGGSCYKKIA